MRGGEIQKEHGRECSRCERGGPGQHCWAERLLTLTPKLFFCLFGRSNATEEDEPPAEDADLCVLSLLLCFAMCNLPQIPLGVALRSQLCQRQLAGVAEGCARDAFPSLRRLIHSLRFHLSIPFFFLLFFSFRESQCDRSVAHCTMREFRPRQVPGQTPAFPRTVPPGLAGQ